MIIQRILQFVLKLETITRVEGELLKLFGLEALKN